MRIARFSIDGDIKFGLVQDGELIAFRGHPLVNDYETTGEVFQFEQVKLLAPTLPSKVVCVGKNYGEHIAEMGLATNPEPTLFFKPNSAIVAHGENIILPHQSNRVELEVELTIVIGKVAKNVSEADAHKIIWGYTISNDVTARDLQETDDQWARSKAFDTFCPMGPWIDTEWQPAGQRISSSINGEVQQDSTLDLMIHNVPRIVSYVSQNMTLLPGDVILTGTPAGSTSMVAGDLVECHIDGLGTLANHVVG
jgi:2-keto-4-pentenoate hydratase/2-oxohepta-3-ene-1,7-dioic acid hydratase in catechol pathway